MPSGEYKQYFLKIEFEIFFKYWIEISLLVHIKFNSSCFKLLGIKFQ